MKRRAAVLGSPVAHSLSPVLHRAAYAELGLDWSYEAIECDEQRLPGVLSELDDSWAGLSLTMPLKRAVLPLLDEVTQLARAVGGANTVVRASGSTYGDNTDVGGAVDALREQGVRRPGSVVVLGAGATAASMLAAVARLVSEDAEHAGDHGGTAVRTRVVITVVVRDERRTGELRAAAGRLGLPVRIRTFQDLPGLLPADLLISTLPGGSVDEIADSLGGSAAGVFDVCYDPWPTRLSLAAEAAGARVTGGFDLLLHQAARQVALMTACDLPDVPVSVMRAAGAAELAARAAAR